MTGQRIGSFEILDKLGEGGMGEVWKARDTRLNRLVALKILPTNGANDDRCRRFQQEAQAASALNHPNIVTIHDIVGGDGHQAIAMEYVAGKTLDRLIPPNGMPLRDVLCYGIAIASGVAAAHHAGIVHRDLKPANVMVTESGLVKVLDFGLAKLNELAPLSGQEATCTVAANTAEGTILGTVSYMSPEQAEGRSVDSRSDIFSLGAVLYEMVTGRKAFQGDTKISTITAILRDEPKSISGLNHSVPRDLEKIIARCLRKDPERRYQTMTDVRLSLEELKEESDSAKAIPLAAPTQLTTFRLNPIWLAVPLAAVLAAAGMWFWRGASPEPALIVKPFTTYPGIETSPAVSPDGKMIAFTWDGEKQDNADIYVKFVSSTQAPLRLTSSVELERGPVWSPDGQRIAFTLLEGDFSPVVHEVSVLGGSARRICPGSVQDWSPDGDTLLIDRPTQREGAAGIFLASVASGEARRLTTISGDQILPSGTGIGTGQVFASNPRFVPDGSRILLTKGTHDQSIVEMDLNGRETRKVETAGLRFAVLQGLLPGGKEFVVNGRRDPGGLLALYRVPVSGGPAREIPFGQGSGPRWVSAARTAPVLAFAEGVSNGNIWRVQAWPGGDRRPQLTMSSKDLESSPAFSPDGSRVAFASSRSGGSQISISDPEGRSATQVTNMFGGVTGTPAWSPDGTQIAFDSRVDRNPDVWVVPSGGGSPQRLTTHNAEDVVPAWSLDGKWIYFTSNRTGRLEVWRLPSGGGPIAGNEEQITRGGGFNARFSVDGRFLYYLKTRINGELWRMPAEGGKEELVIATQKTRNFFLTADGIYTLDYLDSGTGPFQSRPGVARFYRFKTGKFEDLGFQTAKPIAWTGIALSPDGQWLYYSQFDERGSNIMLVENFR